MSEEINSGRLRAFVERIERCEEEKKQIGDDIKEIYAEAKGEGFDAKILRKIVAMRKLDADKRREEEALLGVYMRALGMLADTPRGQAATERAVAEAGNGKGRGKVSFRAEVRSELLKVAGKLGKPVALNDDEKAKGMSAAFAKDDGSRMSIGIDVPVA